ncbi:hypothetical protein E1B28_006940 [Marasmius oreades]|uniref:Uncharacterized protein n=1 Tax=Marasmius oreades TaxID=181124 RepID=A0A9P7USX4_9AGAR|nr:uncharacterized protein E1B28_006940 [Marasmius oreades]KAG7093257.1 hypothetical protein E1B28_006940 [Marasmius oreades]
MLWEREAVIYSFDPLLVVGTTDHGNQSTKLGLLHCLPPHQTLDPSHFASLNGLEGYMPRWGVSHYQLKSTAVGSTKTTVWYNLIIKSILVNGNELGVGVLTTLTESAVQCDYYTFCWTSNKLRQTSTGSDALRSRRSESSIPSWVFKLLHCLAEDYQAVMR